MSLLDDALNKIESKVDAIADAQEEAAEVAAENEKEAREQYEEEFQEALEELNDYVEDDEFEKGLEILSFLKTYEDKKGKSLSEEVCDKLHAKVKENEEEVDAIVRAGNADSSRSKINKLLEKRFALQDRSREIYNSSIAIGWMIGGDSIGGDSIEIVLGQCYLTCEGFKARRDKSLQSEEVVRIFSCFHLERGEQDPRKQWPSKLIPLIKKGFEDRARLIKENI